MIRTKDCPTCDGAVFSVFCDACGGDLSKNRHGWTRDGTLEVNVHITGERRDDVPPQRHFCDYGCLATWVDNQPRVP